MFDESRARRVIRFIECQKHTKGEFHGKPFHLLPWQEKIVRDVFGTVRDEAPDMRQFNQVYIEIGKKNGKSELGAALALNMLINDDEWKAEVYSCASDRQQAGIVFDVAVDMVQQNPTLRKLVKIIPSTKRMVYQPAGSIYQVLSSEVATKHGLNVSACIFDELHTQPTRALYDVMTQGSGDARKQPLWFFLTTAGTDRNSVCWEVHQKAMDILEGRKRDPRFYPIVYGLPDSADWKDERNWYKCNPSLGHTITIDMVPFGQGFKDMSPPTKELMRLVLEHNVAHGGHPVLRWNMDNAYVRTDPAGNQKIDKQKSTEKVDGAVALVMGLDRAMKNGNGGGSVYDSRGLLVLD
ncbi:MAG: terminase large subunit [Eubacteriales bacterium]|nr:terminase large subunit [Eubacteriales bacterium]